MEKKSSHRIIIAYIPVIHAGHLQLLQQFSDITELYLVDREFLSPEFKSIEKDIRALTSQEIRASLLAMHVPQTHIEILRTPDDLKRIDSSTELIMPDDEVLHWLAETYFAEHAVSFDSSHFLRWDKPRSVAKRHVEVDAEVTNEELHHQWMSRAEEVGTHSADWWRQVGSILVKDGQLIAEEHNYHAPYEQQQYIFGDARANFSSGEHIDISTSVHSEQAVIGKAAAQGIPLNGADLYTQTFPCPYCARLIAYSGIKRLFFKVGYSMLDGEEILRQRGVELIKVV